MNPMEIVALIILSPFLTYFIMKFGTYGYYRAKHMAKRKEDSTMRDD